MPQPFSSTVNQYHGTYQWALLHSPENAPWIGCARPYGNIHILKGNMIQVLWPTSGYRQVIAYVCPLSKEQWEGSEWQEKPRLHPCPDFPPENPHLRGLPCGYSNTKDSLQSDCRYWITGKASAPGKNFFGKYINTIVGTQHCCTLLSKTIPENFSLLSFKCTPRVRLHLNIALQTEWGKEGLATYGTGLQYHLSIWYSNSNSSINNLQQ